MTLTFAGGTKIFGRVVVMVGASQNEGPLFQGEDDVAFDLNRSGDILAGRNAQNSAPGFIAGVDRFLEGLCVEGFTVPDSSEVENVEDSLS